MDTSSLKDFLFVCWAAAAARGSSCGSWISWISTYPRKRDGDTSVENESVGDESF